MVELIWDGKYDKDGNRVAPLRVKLPFQTVETINASAQQRQMTLDLTGGKQTEWRNRLIWGDKKYVLPSLLGEFAGKIDLIYIDPPFNVGSDFSFTATIPDLPETEENEETNFIKEPNVIEQKAYRDTWGRGLDSYLPWFNDAIWQLRDLLSENGTIYVHCDWRINSFIRVILDEVFNGNYRGEIIWKKDAVGKGAKKQANHWPKTFDNIIAYGKSEKPIFHTLFAELSEKQLKEFSYEDPDGRKFKRTTLGDYSETSIKKFEEEGYIYISSTGNKYKKYYLDEYTIPMDSIWTDIPGFGVATSSKELMGYPTQKPETVLERIIKTSSDEQDLVMDCFCGSGTTAAVAEKLNRRWIACDLGRFAIHITRKRLLGIPDVKPFVVQNLGKYERQTWQATEFGTTKKAESVQTEYRNFILELYSARPIGGYAWLHGIKDGRMVHVGAVDSPIAPNDIKQIAIEFKKAVGTGKDAPGRAAVDVLGWDFAFEINELGIQEAKDAGINLRCFKIPRDVMDPKAVEQGDVKFFELAALAVDVKKKNQEVFLELTDFTIPPDDVPDDVQKAIKHWSQWIDYCAVDWENRSDTFHNEWQTYRTRQDPSLTLKTSRIYEESGEYAVMVKVIDILGNDTTKLLKVKV